MLCSHLTENCIFLYFLEAKNPCFVAALKNNFWYNDSLVIALVGNA